MKTSMKILVMVGQHMGRIAWMFGAPIDPRLLKVGPPSTGAIPRWRGTGGEPSHRDELRGLTAARPRRALSGANARL